MDECVRVYGGVSAHLGFNIFAKFRNPIWKHFQFPFSHSYYRRLSLSENASDVKRSDELIEQMCL